MSAIASTTLPPPIMLRRGRLPTFAATSGPIVLDDGAQDWEPRATPRRVPVRDFWTFLTAEELPDRIWRPKVTGLKHGRKDTTAEGYWRKLHQIYEESGFDLEAYFATHGTMPWEREPPPFERLLAWRGNLRRAAKMRNYRKLLIWLCAYWGLRDAMLPPFIERSWSSTEMVNRAIMDGLITPRVRHFHPEEIRTLLASRPFTDRLKSGWRWNDHEQRRIAAYKDDMMHTMVFLGAYTAPRDGEWKFLKVKHYDREQRRIVAWPQEKDKLPRNPATPEKTIFTADIHAHPGLEWWLDNRHPKPHDPEADMFPQPDGTSYEGDVSSIVLGKAIKLVLGPKSPHSHGLRRFAATWAHYHGWNDEAVAKLLDDDWKNVRKSYIDWDWLADKDRLEGRGNRPPRALLRSNGNRTLYTPLADPDEDAARLNAPKGGSVP